MPEGTRPRFAWRAGMSPHDRLKGGDGIDDLATSTHAGGMKDKFHKGQRHKGCGLCDAEKRAGNGEERRPARDRRQVGFDCAAVASEIQARDLISSQ